jgi:DNA modification methylase
MGTGSTAAAALRLDKRAIGIDLSAAYLDTAQRRVNDLMAKMNGTFRLKF